MTQTSIILADDHQIILDGLRSMLNGHRLFRVVATANNGNDLLKNIDIFQPDLVISDIEMPGLNGFDAAKLIRERYPQLKIIILSMYKEPSLIKKLIAIGVDGYLIKTSDQEELIAGILQVIKGQKFFAGEVTVALTQPDQPENQQSEVLERIAGLSDRELEIVKLICEGLNNREIGEQLFISHRTVDTHRTNLMRKLEVHSVVELIKIALKSGLIEE
jgi:DNA-binding NarL/FixJ family response regulator